MAMTIDRYNIIVHAVRSRRTRTTRKALLVNVYIWAGSLVLQLPALIMTDAVNYRCDVEFESLPLRVIYHCYVTASTYFCPLMVILCCYLGILYKVWQKSTRGTESAEAHLRSNYRKRRITRMVFIVVILFALCWLPTNVFRMWRATDNNQRDFWIHNWEVMNILSSFIIVLSYSNSLINPFVYAFITTAFRKCVQDSLCSKGHAYDSHVTISNEMKTISTQRCAREAETS
ncbi:Somatostatin receptor type 5 [Holothuria leucospilota]|uniref:Somatostatin receptor type 5 n=1 Tax=Holothuria leucospilota TaxID=206669 RepID=A0A9Q1H229_HOLLE|nr:Somatostatin receptor type 5 [Holothuria leucospilota]